MSGFFVEDLSQRKKSSQSVGRGRSRRIMQYESILGGAKSRRGIMRMPVETAGSCNRPAGRKV